MKTTIIILAIELAAIAFSYRILLKSKRSKKIKSSNWYAWFVGVMTVIVFQTLNELFNQ